MSAPSGLLIVDKPAGPTSHDVVTRVRRTLREQRVGHTGTLDPAASGVLPVVVGIATRLARYLSGATKEYRASIRLGIATDTYDAEGTVTSRHDGPFPGRDEVEEVLKGFRGSFVQYPPAYSAKKIDGERSHRLARKAAAARTPLERPEAVEVTALRCDLASVTGSLVELDVECSAGFYVRSLAHDLGECLGVGGHLEALRRTRSGEWSLADATPLAEIDGRRDAALAALVPLRRMLTALPALQLTSEGVRLTQHGRRLGPESSASGWPPAQPAATIDRPLRLLDPEGELIALGRTDTGTGEIHPFVVLTSGVM